MALAAPPSPARAAPVLDGNIDDVILLASQNIANGSAAGILTQDPVKDICFTDTLFLPCDGVYQTSLNGCRYYVNGFDIARVALAVVDDQVWLGMRVSGNIADTDGDGTDSAGVDCPARSSGRMPDDPPGIADGENYRFFLDTNCDGVRDYIISVHGGAGGVAPVVDVTDGVGVAILSVTSAQARFAGTDLEIRLQGLPLPGVFSLVALAGSTFSGMSFDLCGPVKTNAPILNTVLESLAPADSFVLRQPKWVSLHLTNQSRVPVEMSVLDLLPSDWQFTGNWSGDLPLESALGSRLVFTSPEVSAESTAVVRFEVAAQRGGVSEVNRALAYASYENSCLSEPLTALTDTVRGQWVASLDTTTAASQAEHPTLLGSAAPNPFRTSTRIWFTLGGSEAGHVRVCLYDAAGRLVRTLIDGSRAPGRYEMTWNGRRDDGSTARGGVYFAQAWIGERRLADSSRVLYLR